MRDPILAGFVTALSSNTDLELPVVVMSHGLVIEGTLVSEARWLDELAALLEAGSPAAAAFASVFRNARAHVEMAAAVEGPTADLVHLTGARVWAGGRLEAVGPWRLRFDAVEGWKLGKAMPALAGSDQPDLVNRA